MGSAVFRRTIGPCPEFGAAGVSTGERRRWGAGWGRRGQLGGCRGEGRVGLDGCCGGFDGSTPTVLISVALAGGAGAGYVALSAAAAAFTREGKPLQGCVGVLVFASGVNIDGDASTGAPSSRCCVTSAVSRHACIYTSVAWNRLACAGLTPPHGSSTHVVLLFGAGALLLYLFAYSFLVFLFVVVLHIYMHASCEGA